jgi:hypothetical protein
VSRTAGIPTEWHDFQPRIGFAATLPFKTVLRGGFATTYWPQNSGSSTALSNPPNTSVYVYGAPLGDTQASRVVLGQSSFSPIPASACLSTSCGATQMVSIRGESFGFKNLLLYQTSLAIEKEFSGNVLSVGYVGEFGRHMGRVLPNADFPLPPLGPGGCGTTQTIYFPSPCQPYYNQLNLINVLMLATPTGLSNYNALQVNFQRRYKHGVTLASNFTWAHGLSNMHENTGRNACGGCGLKLNDADYDYGSSLIDSRYRFTLTGNYELPFGKSLKGVAGQVIKGWQINAIYVYSTGEPFTLTNSSNPQENIGAATGQGGTLTGDRPNRLAPSGSFNQSINQWFDTTAFALQPWGTAGNEGRNPYRGPRTTKVDFSLFKNFSIRESMKLQFRAEVFNLTNTPSFAYPGISISGWTSTNPATAVPTQAGNFGKITATSEWYTPRLIQGGLKLVF